MMPDEVELLRLQRLSSMEDSLRSAGATYIAGVDEVGRGALAGPLTVCAVILPPGCLIIGLDDSKRLSPTKRRRIASEIERCAVDYSVTHIESALIDRDGLPASLKSAVASAVAGLRVACCHVLLDGPPLRVHPAETSVVRGDSQVAAIAAASIVAKVHRDALMQELDTIHPEYGFATNKGYGTAHHLEMIRTHGVTSAHRRSFHPCAGLQESI
ncbi:MAG: ribonuclease HII [Actinobacteria bacterium]|nr:ribonuclease HII [Actinomycetota bacterium]